MDSGPHDPNLLHSWHPATHLIHVKPSLRATNDSFREPGWVPARISSKLIHRATGAKPHPSTTVFMESGASPERVARLPFNDAVFQATKVAAERHTDDGSGDCQRRSSAREKATPGRRGRYGWSRTLSAFWRALPMWSAAGWIPDGV